MTRLLFLPVSRFSVAYIAASGRPFSELDRLVLRAIVENDSPTLDSLKETFQLPQRPLLENLVTLFHCGWIAMNSQGRFLPTEEGIRALRLRTVPVSMRTRPFSQMILMECLMGLCVAVRGGVRYYTELQLKQGDRWDFARIIAPVISGIAPDEGVVRGLLPKRKGEWIHSISAPVARGHCAYFLSVVVDTESGRIVGLPDRWLPLLEDSLMAEAMRASDVEDRTILDERPFVLGQLPSDERRDTLGPDDLLTTVGEQREALRAALSDAPSGSWIFIAGERINPQCLQAWGEAFSAALMRGVNIDLAWRTIERTYSNEPGEVQLKRQLALINETVGDQQRPGMLRASLAPSQGRAHFVLVVPPDPETPSAWIGGWDWLGAEQAPSRAVVSVRIRELELLSNLALTAAALLESASSGTLLALPEAWRELAERLEQRRFAKLAMPDEGLGNCEVRLLRDREIERSIAELVNVAATVQLRTRSDVPESSLLTRLVERVRTEPAFSARVHANFPPPDGLSSAWLFESGNLAEAMIADDTVIVLSSPIGGTSLDEVWLADVGLAVKGGPVVEKLTGLWAVRDHVTPNPTID
jgi:hypothetical protein